MIATLLSIFAVQAASVASADISGVKPGDPRRVSRTREQNLAQFDLNKDGAFDRREWIAMNWSFYAGFDANKDGRISMQEYANARCGGVGDYPYCLRIFMPAYKRADPKGLGYFTVQSGERLLASGFRTLDRDRNGLVTKGENG